VKPKSRKSDSSIASANSLGFFFWLPVSQIVWAVLEKKLKETINNWSIRRLITYRLLRLRLVFFRIQTSRVVSGFLKKQADSNIMNKCDNSIILLILFAVILDRGHRKALHWNVLLLCMSRHPLSIPRHLHPNRLNLEEIKWCGFRFYFLNLVIYIHSETIFLKRKFRTFFHSFKTVENWCKPTVNRFPLNLVKNIATSIFTKTNLSKWTCPSRCSLTSKEFFAESQTKHLFVIS